ncbi:ggdef family protein [Nautilia profundicola AmH]|uniref:Ggdef family protein n=1 Tax=Nautilia profundicola (strain ATCC BAA-1463 / DSM 18972 / AmH) TaxID=598659 RepID=B9L731_NAUPA|nr:EAL domain-containing protein [Nautilia profundicola]ACM92933.1 ggdef family protein [Nautilia profundicola AmH]
MSKIENLKGKILKHNTFSIFIILTFITIFSFLITYIIIYEKYQSEIDMIKNNYIENQKNMMKHQVNNIINLIETLRTAKTQNVKDELKTVNITSAKILELSAKNKYFPILSQLDNQHECMSFTLSDLNANLIYTKTSDYNKTKRMNLIKKLLKENKNSDYFIHKTPKGTKITYQHIFNNFLLTTFTYQAIIDKFVKNRIIQVIYNIRFGPKNNGYISVAEILNYKGGKNFAKVVALPVKPSMVGKLLSDDKKDAKGKLYRKEYLKIANTTGEGFVSYWFYKYSDKIIRPKISYVKLYKPWNWLIFTSVFIDDIDNVLSKKEAMFKQEIKKLVIFYIALYLVIFLITIFIVRRENGIIKSIIDEFERKLQEKSILLEHLNKNLMNEVIRKTDELTKNMFTDNLTNLPNREKLINDFKDKYIAIINIDDFKEINDFFGVNEGDKLIKEFGEFLNSIDKTYKLSADEYAIIDDKPAKLKHKATEIINKLKNKKFKIGNDEIKINITVGIGETLAQADTALKYAKKRKKQIIVYNKNLPILKEFEENLKWKKIINEAIENNNVIPYIQAIIDNKTKKIKKYECLMRIKHEGKIFTPYYFLEIAKKTHQYETLQKIIIEKCFKKFSKLPYNFSINLSLRDLKNEQFIKYLIKKIEKYNVAEKLTIELLEDEEMISDKKINEIIHQLSKMGVKIAIDDFGSGYSNFVYLIKNLPINTIKIDGTLVKDIINDEKLKKLLKKIVEIAKEFNFETIAEFVENEELYIELLHLDVDASQGYHFSKPFDIEELK